MAIVKSVKVAAGKAGSVLDNEDRKLLGQVIVLAGGTLATAATVGLAIRVFFLAMG